MKRERVGYFAGTDPVVLSSLICDGYDTLPVSNGEDNHGVHVRRIDEHNRVQLLIGYLHKIFAVEDSDTRYQDIFRICSVYEVPLLVMVPGELHDKARQLLADPPEIVQLVDPSNTLAAAREVLREVAKQG